MTYTLSVTQFSVLLYNMIVLKKAAIFQAAKKFNLFTVQSHAPND